MSEALVITERDSIERALVDSRLIPHAHPDAGAGGRTMELRAEMARFSRPTEHPGRRAAADRAVRRLDVDAVIAEARVASKDLLADGLSAESVDAVIRSVPTIAVGTVLGATPDDSRLVDDVAAIVRVIGRGEPPTGAADEATRRLVERFAEHPDGAVAAVSILYQNFDATSALIRNLLESTTSGEPPAPAVAATRRVATTEVLLDREVIPAGSEITLMIGAAGLPFGAGPHACPGQALAIALANAVVDELAAARP